MSIAIAIQKPNSNYSTAALCHTHRIMQLLEVISIKRTWTSSGKMTGILYITAKYKLLPPIQYRGIHPGCPHGDERC